jgi:DNA-binding NarL/FixJ family response regulator
VHQLTAAGAAGYVIKQTAASDLINAVREVSKGNAFFSPPVLKQLLEYYRESCKRGGMLQPQSGGQLTSREQEVLQLVAEGHVNKQIASTLFLSIKTVEKHRQQLMNKLGIHDIAGLTRYAIAHGVVESRRRLVGDEAGEAEGATTESAPATVPDPAIPAVALEPKAVAPRRRVKSA